MPASAEACGCMFWMVSVAGICENNVKKDIRHPLEIRSLYRRLDDFIRDHPEQMREAVKQFEERAAKSHLRYAGKALLVGFYPFIIAKEEVGYIAGVVESTMRLMEKITRLFLAEPQIRRQFSFSPEQLELIEIEPGYQWAIPCARFDSFYDGDNLRFSELNTDGSSGMDSADRISHIYFSSPPIQEFFRTVPLHLFDICQGVLETLLACYRQFSGRDFADRPRIAIVDWKEVRTSAEFLGLSEFCCERGYETLIADPRELEYDGKTLSHGGSKIDIVYRRVVSHEYVEHLDEVKPMTQAFRDHNVCVVGSFRSDVAFSKRVFAVIHNPELAGFFTEEERCLATQHVPWTHFFSDVTAEYEGQEVSIPALAKESKDRFVLKPSSLYEGRGVKIGAVMQKEEWEEAIVSALKNDYVLQERIYIPSMSVAVWSDGMEMEQRLLHLGEFVFGGRFRGLYCRAANTLVIDSRSKELLLPALILQS
jgi:hypothetical protein